MNQGSSQESVRKLKPWHFGLLMFSFYWFWGSVFTEATIPSQIAFNFAVFYPAGFLAGYFHPRARLRDVYIVGFVFDALTYAFVLGTGQTIKADMVGADFISMVLCIFIGVYVGKRTAA